MTAEEFEAEAFRFEEALLESWIESCEAKIICIELLEDCVKDAFTPHPPLNTEIAEDSLKISNFPIPVRPPRKKTLEPKTKTNFILEMDTTYHSILRLGDILEENEQTPTKMDPPTPESPPKKAKIAQKPKTHPPKEVTPQLMTPKKLKTWKASRNTKEILKKIDPEKTKF